MSFTQRENLFLFKNESWTFTSSLSSSFSTFLFLPEQVSPKTMTGQSSINMRSRRRVTRFVQWDGSDPAGWEGHQHAGISGTGARMRRVSTWKIMGISSLNTGCGYPCKGCGSEPAWRFRAQVWWGGVYARVGSRCWCRGANKEWRKHSHKGLTWRQSSEPQEDEEEVNSGGNPVYSIRAQAKGEGLSSRRGRLVECYSLRWVRRESTQWRGPLCEAQRQKKVRRT